MSLRAFCGGAYFYRDPASGNRAHAQIKFHIYTFVRLVAVVFRPGVCRNEVGKRVAYRPALEHILHESDAAVVLLLVAGIARFVWTHWETASGVNQA